MHYLTQLIVHLIKRCLDANPLNRPTAKEIYYYILLKWRNEFQATETELKKQIKKAEEINDNLSTNSTISPTDQ